MAQTSSICSISLQFRDSGRYYVGEPLVADDGTNWNLDYLDNQAFDRFVSAISCTRYIVMNIIRCQTFSAWMTSMYMSGCSMSERCINGKRKRNL